MTHSTRTVVVKVVVSGLALLGAMGCRPRDFNSTHVAGAGAPLSKTSEEAAPNDFRNIFYTYLKHANYPEERIQQQIFSVPKELLAEGSYSAGGAEALAGMKSRFAKVKPSDLYALGTKTPFHLVDSPEAIFTKQGPVTIVLVPGIFGEFIEKRPFEEVLGSGSFSARFTGALRGQTTSVYSLRSLDKVQIPLSEAASIGSLDNGSGQPLVNLILLRPGFASLETLGTLESNTETYLKRLEQVFSVIPAEATRNLYFMGYSRGTPVALNLLATAFRSSAKYPWVQRVRGFVGLAGVYWGTELADDALDDSQKSLTSKAIGTLNWLGNELKTTNDTSGLSGFMAAAGGAGVVASNTAKWAQAANEFSILGERQKSEAPAGALAEMQQLQADQMDFMAMGSMLWKVSVDTLNLRNAATDYDRNVLKFKKLIGEAVLGLRTLTVKSSLQWWRQNTLPPQIKMFSITASMPDAPVGGTPSPMLGFDPYGPKTADFVASLRGSFHTLAAMTGNQINDSQVTQYGSRYWPGLHRALNPSQPQLKHYFLGSLGTHHWGLAFPIAFKTSNSDVNHFPRPILLKSIGTYLALSQEN